MVTINEDETQLQYANFDNPFTFSEDDVDVTDFFGGEAGTANEAFDSHFRSMTLELE